MKDEIKEILDRKKRSLEYNEAMGLTSIKIQDDKILLDYITNLQDRIKELEAINEEHKKINGELRATIKANETVLMLYKNNTDLINNRINKAIELWDMCGSELITTFQEKAINILQGEDK